MIQNAPVGTIPIYMIDASSGLLVTGLAISPSTDVAVSKNGGAWVAATGTIAETGAGKYSYTPVTADFDTLGKVDFKVDKSGYVLYIWTEDVIAQPITITGLLGTIIRGSNTLADTLRGMEAAVIGRTSGYDSGTITIKDPSGTKTLWTVTTTSDGRVTVIQGDLT